MKPGPKTQPTKLKIIRGNPGQRRLPKNEPKPPLAKKMKCPFSSRDDKNHFAREEWNRIVPELCRQGLISKIDVNSLRAYCEAVQVREESYKFLREKGNIVPTKNYKGEIIGYIRAPQLLTWEKAIMIAVRLGAEFGLTPSSRVGLEVENKQVEIDELDEILNS